MVHWKKNWNNCLWKAVFLRWFSTFRRRKYCHCCRHFRTLYFNFNIRVSQNWPHSFKMIDSTLKQLLFYQHLNILYTFYILSPLANDIVCRVILLYISTLTKWTLALNKMEKQLKHIICLYKIHNYWNKYAKVFIFTSIYIQRLYKWRYLIIKEIYIFYLKIKKGIDNNQISSIL